MSPEAIEQIRPHYRAHRNKVIDGEFCSPDGSVAIVTPLVSRHAKERKVKKELDYYRQDADAMASRFRDMGIGVIDCLGATAGDLTSILQDEHIKGMVLIGNGAYTGIETSNGLYDWRNAAVASWALKEFVIQRTCGIATDRVNLPFGTFAVSDQSNIVAPNYDRFIPDDNPGDEHFFRPFDKPLNTPEEIQAVHNRLEVIRASHGIEIGSATMCLINFIGALASRGKN